MGHIGCVLFAIVVNVRLKAIETHSGVSVAHIKVLIFVREVIHNLSYCFLSTRLASQVIIDYKHGRLFRDT
jgi:hypothetical protein